MSSSSTVNSNISGFSTKCICFGPKFNCLQRIIKVVEYTGIPVYSVSVKLICQRGENRSMKHPCTSFKTVNQYFLSSLHTLVGIHPASALQLLTLYQITISYWHPVSARQSNDHSTSACLWSNEKSIQVPDGSRQTFSSSNTNLMDFHMEEAPWLMLLLPGQATMKSTGLLQLNSTDSATQLESRLHYSVAHKTEHLLTKLCYPKTQ